MKSYVLILALVQSLGCSGVPLHYSELESMADSSLGAALAEINSVYAVSHLYRVTRVYVKKVFPVGLNTVDLLLMIGIKETECAKASGSEPQTCAFRPGVFVPTLSCSSRVRLTATSAQVSSVRCSHDGSSSSESSEEIFSRGKHQFNTPFANRVPAPPETPSPPPVRPRGHMFNNFLE